MRTSSRTRSRSKSRSSRSASRRRSSRSASRRRSSRSSSRNRRRGKKIYHTLDNGGNHFNVHVSGKTVTVVQNLIDYGRNSPTWGEKLGEKQVLSLKNVKKVFIGYDPPGFYYNETGKKANLGNSVLVNTKGDEYVYIGENVKKFKTVDGVPITKYLSPIGNSAVPYPFALSRTFAYLMIEDKAVPTYLMKQHNEKDPYQIVYGKIGSSQDFSTKIIVARPV